MHYRVSLKNTLIILALASITSACSTRQPSKPLNIDPTWAPIANSSHSAQLTQLLTAEFTLQRQGSEFASPLYLEAAQQSNQAAVARRATSSAIMSDDNDAVLKASARWLELDPNDASIYPIRLQALLVDGDTNSAAELIQQALDSQVSLAFLPNFVDQNIRQTDITEQLEAVLSQEALRQSIYVEIAQYHLLFIKGGYPFIVENIDGLMSRSPKTELEGLIIIKAFSEEQLGFSKKALRTLEKGLAQFPGSQRITANLLETLIKTNQYKRALEAFYTADLSPFTAQQVGLAMGQLLLQKGQTLSAIELLSSLPKQGALKDQLLFILANAQYQAGQTDSAISNLLHVYGQLSWNASELLVTWLYDEKQEKLINPLILQRAQQEQEAGHVSGVADLHLERNQPELAIDLLSRSIKVFPEIDGLRYKRAITYDTLEQWPQALADLQWLLNKHPDDSAYMNALGYTMLVRSPKDFNQAFTLIKQAYQLDSDDPAILDSMGWAYFKKGDLDEAVDFLQQAWTQMQDAEIGAHYGEVLWQLANSDKAIEIWQEALQDNPNLPILRKTIKQYAPELLTEHKEST
jgi:tetratricopeptide (TPR) repeat protein